MFLLLLMAAENLPAFVHAQKNPPLNSKKMNYQSCVTTECHTSLKNQTSVHGPVRANGCYLCHTPQMKTHTFTLAQIPNVCLQCHDEIKDSKFFSSHTLKHESLDQKRACLTCHSPHASSHPRLLKLTEMNLKTDKDLCLTCHKSKIKSHAHPIPQEESCTTCHSFHFGKPKTPLMRVSKNKKESVCIECHREKKIFSEKAPDTQACVACHQRSSFKSVKHIDPIFDHPDILFPDETKMTCHTCHEAHVQTSFRRSYLKKSSERIEFCSMCHGGDAPTLYKKFHKIKRGAPSS